MNPKVDIIVPRDTGHFSINPVGRVGTYESAVRRHRCRARHHWIIEEDLAVAIPHHEGATHWNETRREREDFGQFKTKKAAIQFMIDYAAAHREAKIEGDLQGYPRLIVPDQTKCRHKFIDSDYCLKCGWKPPKSEQEKREEFAEEQEAAMRSEAIAEHKDKS